MGSKAAEATKGFLEGIFKGVDMAFITAGMGGGKDTGAAPMAARIARGQGTIVVGMVTHHSLSREEGQDAGGRMGHRGPESRGRHHLFIDNNRRLDLVPDLPLEHAFSAVDQLMAEIIKVVTETITVSSLINLDYADVRTIMSSGVPSFMIAGTGCLDEPPEEIVRSAIKQNHLLGTDYRGAKGCLLHITGGLDLTLRDAAALAGALTQELDEKANVIWVARIREDFEGKVRMVAIITGVRSVQVLGPCDGIRDYSVKADEVKAGVTRRIL